jgi:nicotinate-nucleotide--dimethylbenzimidazole phosphoribosyltransferase
MSIHESLISPTTDADLERRIRQRLDAQAELGGSFGQLDGLAVRLGLLQGSPTPRFRDPVLAFFAADHGLAVGAGAAATRSATLAAQALQGRMPACAVARLHGLQVQVVDCGLADELSARPRLLQRRIAHGSRHTRLGPAMTSVQVQAALRVGMEVADAAKGNVMALAALGQGHDESAALLLARLSGQPLADYLPRATSPAQRESLETAFARHASATDPLDALSAMGGFDIAAMVGAILVGASKRSLLLIDGLAACAALRLAASIAPPVTDYAVFCRSHGEPGLTRALHGFQAGALLDLGLESGDGLGAALAWPLLRSAAALLSDAPEPAPFRASAPVDLPLDLPSDSALQPG